MNMQQGIQLAKPPGTDLHSLGVHPVLDVLHRLVHAQEDGLVTVIQT